MKEEGRGLPAGKAGKKEENAQGSGHGAQGQRAAWANRLTGIGYCSRGITTLEYAVLIACLVAALVSFQTGLRRALCAKWRETADAFGSGRQYDPATTTVVNL